MNKKQSFEAMWIPVSKQFPPNTGDTILIHERMPFGSDVVDYYETRKAGLVRQHIQEDINHRDMAPMAKHWMPIYDPKK